MILSEVDSVYSGDSFPFLHEERGFLITLRGADAALRVNSTSWNVWSSLFALFCASSTSGIRTLYKFALLGRQGAQQLNMVKKCVNSI
jgi:hypothetical protein